MKKNTLLNLLNKNVMDLENRIRDSVNYLGNTTNLKLYDVSMYCYDNNIEDDYFNFFCECEYNYFNDTLKENNIELKYIGRTSTFRVIGDNYFNGYWSIYDIEDFDNNISIREKIGYIIENYFYKEYNIGLEFEYNKEGDIINFDYNELKNYMLGYNDSKEVLKNLYVELLSNNVLDELYNIESTYKYINDFKENQIEIFKEYLECIEE